MDASDPNLDHQASQHHLFSFSIFPPRILFSKIKQFPKIKGLFNGNMTCKHVHIKSGHAISAV